MRATIGAQRLRTAHEPSPGLDASGAYGALIAPAGVRPRAPNVKVRPSAVPAERGIAAREQLPARLLPGSLLAPSRLPVSPAIPLHLDRPQLASHAAASHARSGRDVVGRALARGLPTPQASAQSVLSRALAMTLPAVEVSNPADLDEREAERVANALSGGRTGYDEHRMSSTRSDTGILDRAAVSAGTESSAAAETAPPGGQPLDEGVRAWFEPRLGVSLGGVRIHNDGAAAEAARHLHARAFGFGGHVGFAAGEYAPETAGGHRLLAHELAHVVQERRGAAPAIRRMAGAAEPSDLISRYKSWLGNIDDKALGQRLFELAWMSPDHYAFVIDVIDALPSGDRDDVSLYFALSAREENLDEFARTEDGRRMLQRMESELLSGLSRFQEREEALRLRQAAARQSPRRPGWRGADSS